MMNELSNNLENDDLIRKITEDSLMSVAVDNTTSADVLQELAESDLSSPRVREAVAANEACSTDTNLFLCEDEEAEVRKALAKKAAHICAPENPNSKKINREDATVLLRKIAADTEESVRQTLAEAIKDSDHIPPEIAQTLARDVAESVAMPVLEYSPLLGDEDLLDIIASSPGTRKLCAISKRPSVSEQVSDRLIDTQNQAVIPALLKNANAQIREDALNRIVEGAKNNQSWQEALITRPELPPIVSQRIEKYISVELINHLYSRGHVDVDGAKQLMGRVKERLSKTAQPAWEKPDQNPKAPAIQTESEGVNEEEFLCRAINDGNFEAVYAEISHRSRLRTVFVRRALICKNAKVITALCWKAGLSAAMAEMIQKKMARLDQQTCISPTAEGRYILSKKEMNWHLEVFGANRACNIN